MQPAEPPPLDPALVVLLAAGAGVSVATLYFNQPVLQLVASDLHASRSQVGLVPTLTQLGYAAGIFLFAPFGDRLDRRRVILAKLLLLALALLAAALAPSIAVLAVVSVAVGLLATAAQDFVPAAAALASPAHRGKAVGRVMSGLLLGILLSRVVSGALSDRLGWRSVYLGAAGVVGCLLAFSAKLLPAFAPTTRASYGALLRSILALARDLAPVRRAALAQALLSVAFSAFWSTLALELTTPRYGLGSTAAGAFGLAGAAGALIAPVAGSIADKRGPSLVIRLGSALTAASFVLMGLAQGSVVVLVAGTVAFDLGVQACLISHQTIIYALVPEARSRLNAILLTTMFVGMSSGAALGSFAFARVGWTGVTALGAFASIGALVVRALPERAPSVAGLR
jgi:predicted MFS family arabinose efflux permease